MEKNNYRLELYINGKRNTNQEQLLHIYDRTEEEANIFAEGMAFSLHILGKNFYIDLYQVNADGSETYIKKQM